MSWTFWKMPLMKIHQMNWNNNGGLREQAALFVLGGYNGNHKHHAAAHRQGAGRCGGPFRIASTT